MKRLPPVSARDVLKVLHRLGFDQVGRKGSHIRLKRKTEEKTFIVIVPYHDEISPGTLLSIIRQAGISREQFLAMLQE